MFPPLPTGFRPAEPAPGMTYTPPEQFPFVSITWKKGTMILEKGPLLGRTTAPSLRLMKTNEHYLNLFQQFPVPALGGRAVTLCLLPWCIRSELAVPARVPAGVPAHRCWHQDGVLLYPLRAGLSCSHCWLCKPCFVV